LYTIKREKYTKRTSLLKSKNLVRYRSENNFVKSTNNCVGNSSMMSNVAKSYDIPAKFEHLT